MVAKFMIVIFSQRMRGSGIYAEMTQARFQCGVQACLVLYVMLLVGFRQRQDLFQASPSVPLSNLYYLIECLLGFLPPVSPMMIALDENSA